MGKYDNSSELIIDPVVLVYSFYLGGSREESGKSTAVDAAGATMGNPMKKRYKIEVSQSLSYYYFKEAGN